MQAREKENVGVDELTGVKRTMWWFWVVKVELMEGVVGMVSLVDGDRVHVACMVMEEWFN